MEIRIYCDECKEELGFLPSVEEGQISINVLPHECRKTQQGVKSTEIDFYILDDSLTLRNLSPEQKKSVIRLIEIAVEEAKKSVLLS